MGTKFEKRNKKPMHAILRALVRSLIFLDFRHTVNFDMPNVEMQLVYPLWKNEEVYDAKFETKKQQKHEALAAQDNKLIAQLVS